jgi:hypothetical protein
MRLRLALTGLFLLGALAPAAAPALGAPAAPAPVKVKLVDCSLTEHAAAFRGRMNRLADTARMGMRFTLQEHSGGGFETVEAPGLHRWRRSKVGVGTFGYRQGVRNLALNAAYRMRVDFRWWSAGGRVVRRARRRSPVCRQYAGLPNLRARVSGTKGTKVAGVVRYVVRLGNTGRAAASVAAVRLTVDGNVVDTKTVPALGPGEQRKLVFRGPECGQSVEARADPDALVAETSELDNAQHLSCSDVPRR